MQIKFCEEPIRLQQSSDLDRWDMTEPRLEEEAQVCNNMAAALNHGCVVEKTKALSSIGRGGGSGGGEGDVSIYCGVSVLLMRLIKTYY